MPWFGWYSEKQEELYGYAHYLDRKGKLVAVTQIDQNSDFVPRYKDSVRVGLLTHFCGVQRRNGTKRRRREPDAMIRDEMGYERTPIGQPSPLTN